MMFDNHNKETMIDNIYDFTKAGYRIMTLHNVDKNGNCMCGHDDCKNQFKHPRVSNWTQMSGFTPEQIELMAENDVFTYSYGVILGDDDFVVDIDPRNNENALEDLNIELGFDLLESSSFVVKTGSGGYHAFFKKPSDQKISKNLPKFKGIDFLSKGSFVVGAGSLHKSGEVYEFVSNRKSDPSDVCNAPESLLLLVERKDVIFDDAYEAGSSDIEELRSALCAIPNGIDTPYDDWLKLGAALHFETSGSMDGYNLWVEWSSKGDKHDETEMGIKWNSFGKHGVTNKATAGTVFKLAIDNGWERNYSLDIDLTDFLSSFDEEEKLVMTKDDTDDKLELDSVPQELSMMPGIIGEVVNYTLSTAQYPTYIPSVNGALSLCSTICSRDFATDEGNLTSLYFINLAETGAGKEHVFKVMTRILSKMKKSDLIKGDTTSKAAIISELFMNPRAVFHRDEIAHWLKMAGSDKSSDIAKSEIKAIMELFSKLDSEYSSDAMSNTRSLIEGKMDKDGNNRITVKRPAMSILGATTPDKMSESITKMMISDGFLNRFICGFAQEGFQMSQRVGKRKAIPSSILDWIETIERRVMHHYRALGMNEKDDSEKVVDPIIIPFTDEAFELLTNYERKIMEQRNQLKKTGGFHEMLVRDREKAMRLALTVELSKDPYAKNVTADSVAWAVTYVDFLSQQMLKYVKFEMVENDVDRVYKNAYSVIKSFGGKGVHRTELMKMSPFKSISKTKKLEVIEHLTSETEQVFIRELPNESGRGRRKQAFYAIECMDKDLIKEIQEEKSSEKQSN